MIPPYIQSVFIHALKNFLLAFLNPTILFRNGQQNKKPAKADFLSLDFLDIANNYRQQD